MPDFFDLLILMVVIWTAGKVFRAFGLPIVFGELLGGIIVGPALLGIIDPQSETITVLAELGIFFLMLHAGLETDAEEFFKTAKKSIPVGLSGMIIPMLLGIWAGYYFGYPLEASLFIGLGVSVSAIPLMTRLFKDTKLMQTRVAHLSLGAAVVNDIFGLILLSVILSLAQNGGVDPAGLLWMLTKVSLFFLVVVWGGSKTSKWMNRLIYFGNKGFTLTLIIALLMGLIAEAIGLHMIIGAFLAGLFMHEEVIDKKVFEKIEDRVYGLAYGFFGPIFFASLAFHLDVTAFASAPLFVSVILILAVAGKLIGSSLAAKWSGFTNTESLAVGLAMNSRGAVELIIASIGLRMGVIDQTIFSTLVIMAFATTVFSILTMGPVAAKIKA